MHGHLSNFLFFLFVTVIVLGGGHFYLWKRLIRDAQLPKAWRLGLSTVLILLMASVPAIMIASKQLPRESMSSFAFAAFVWMGMLSTYFALLLPTDLTRLGWRGVVGAFTHLKKDKTSEDSRPPVNLERRAAMGRLLAGGVVVSGTAVGGLAVEGALNGFTLAEVEVTLEKLPASFDGLRIVQLSDVHVGPTIGGDFVRSMVETTNSLEPDIIALTGDFVDGSVENLGRHVAPLADLRAKIGSFFVTGNHEYYSGAESWLGEMERLGITTLRNRSQRIRRGDESFLLAGVSDYRAERYGDPPDLKAALLKRKEGEEVILLAHQPREISRAQAEDVGLQLSGHTHGGQFWPWNWVIHLIEPVVAGLAQFGRTQIYVNSGTGYWGPPMRLGTQSEITIITLRSTSA